MLLLRMREFICGWGGMFQMLFLRKKESPKSESEIFQTVSLRI